MRAMAFCLIVLGLWTSAATASEVCLRPLRPLELRPGDDAEMRALIEDDYQRYYGEMQDYLNCLRREYADASQEVRSVTEEWQEHFGD